ncbi:MAG: glucuronate isomerase [Betaproteobacteria bacterium]|jgi:glucuronate isomerase|nr:glucuronate isomerase [Betaproteobacteria bacterium]MDH5286061.1 glucuronate isomerase [Betaproteobacteria bacterium]
MKPIDLHPDRLFPAEPATRALARALYDTVRDLPIVSPHGHTDPQWYADDAPFPDASALLIVPDHYVFRMLYSQGIPLEQVGIPRRDGGPVERDARKIWRTFAAHYHLFRGTPTRMWLDHAFRAEFGMEERLTAESADRYFDRINAMLATPAFRPRALFERFNIEVIATTESPLDPLAHHARIRASGWKGRVVTAYRPDPVVDPEFDGFRANVAKLGEITGENTATWTGYLAAHRNRRAYFKSMGATSTDHGHPTALTCDLDAAACQKLLDRALAGTIAAEEAEQFRGQMLTEMATMSRDDGLVMQIHPGSFRNHNALLFADFGRDKGADIPTRTDYVRALRPLLAKHGNARDLTVILFTLDETSYARELAPLAGHYPILKLGPPWWFHDSPEGMLRFREQATETAGFYNTVGFNDDTRAFLSIPARHDVARRIDCRFLATLVREHRLGEDEAFDLAPQLAYHLAKQAYKL